MQLSPALRLWLRERHRLLVVFVGALLFAGVAQLVGVATEVTRFCQVGYYQMRGPRHASTRAIFVQIDEATYANWGPPPWSWAQWQLLLDPLLQGGAAAVAIVDAGPIVLPSGPPPLPIARAQQTGQLLLPDAHQWSSQPAPHLERGRVVTALSIGTDDSLIVPNVLGDFLRRFGVRAADALYAVNFSTPGTLPTLSALHVARGEIAASAFRGRVVTVGSVGHFASAIPTPVGAMAPAEVIAHAVHAQVTGAGFRRLPTSVSLMMLLGFALALAAVLRRVRTTIALSVLASGGAVAVVALGYGLFWLAYQIEVGVALFAVIGATATAVLHERIALDAELRAGVAMHPHDAKEDAEHATQLAASFLTAALPFLRAQNALWGQLAPGKWHVDYVHRRGPLTDDIIEMRRDIRREPWSAAYLAMRPRWSTRPFFKDVAARDTLLVPVVANGRLRGMFVFAVRATEITEGDLRILAEMADQLAALMAAPNAPTALDAADTPLLADARQYSQIIAKYRAVANEVTDSVEHLPIGVGTSSIWGQLLKANAALVEMAKRFDVALTTDRPLADICAALAGQSTEVGQRWVREVARHGMPISFVATDGKSNSYHVTLARSPAGTGAATLVITTTALGTLLAQRPALQLPRQAPHELCDAAELMRRVLERQPTQLTVGPLAPAKLLTTPTELAAALTEFIAGVASLVGGRGEVRLLDSPEAVELCVAADRVTLVASEVNAMREGEVAELTARYGAQAEVTRVARAREQAKALFGQLHVQSDLNTGTQFTLRFDKRGLS